MADSRRQTMVQTALWLAAAVASLLIQNLWMRQGYNFFATLLWAVAGGWSIGKTISGISQLRKPKSNVRESV